MSGQFIVTDQTTQHCHPRAGGDLFIQSTFPAISRMGSRLRGNDSVGYLPELIQFIKKSIALLITALLFSFVFLCSAKAQTETATQPQNANSVPSQSESYLKDIRDTLLLNITKLPVYLSQLTKMALSWLAPDDSHATAAMQNNLTILANAQSQNLKQESAVQNIFLKEFVAVPASQNDVNHQTVLNQSYTEPDPKTLSAEINNAAYTYTKYAAGLNVIHRPSPTEDIKRAEFIRMYQNYYNTTSAVQTYNGYILSELYADAKNKNKATQVQRALINQASDPNWFTQIASEKVGVILRQILLYNSQNYVLLAELLETQKKLLAAQAMNNALLITMNQETERRMFRKANGDPP